MGRYLVMQKPVNDHSFESGVRKHLKRAGPGLKTSDVEDEVLMSINRSPLFLSLSCLPACLLLQQNTQATAGTQTWEVCLFVCLTIFFPILGKCVQTFAWHCMLEMRLVNMCACVTSETSADVLPAVCGSSMVCLRETFNISLSLSLSLSLS